MNTTFLYKAIFPITKERIYYSISQDEPIEDDIVELFQNETERYRLCAQLFSENDSLIIQALRFEQSFTEIQNPNKFKDYAFSKIRCFLNRINFVSNSLATLENRVEIIDHNGKQTGFTNMRGGVCFGGSIRSFMDKFSLKRACRNESEYLDEYIERYFFSINIIDPVFQLLNLYSLCEFIGNKEIQFDPIITAARHLVAHGTITYEKTKQELDQIFKTKENKYQFSRKNGEHMALVRDSAEKLKLAIGSYISSML